MLNNKIKEQDKFGHEIVLNFNKKGNYHNTLFGGLLSILVNIFILIYIWTLINKVVFFQDDSLLTVSKFDDPFSLGEVTMKSTSFIPGFIFGDFFTDLTMDHFTVEKYLDIEFKLIEKDWTKSPPEMKETRLKHRKCVSSDFSEKHLPQYKVFEKLNQIFCLADMDKIYLKGDMTSSWQNKFVKMSIKKCQKKPGKTCPSDYEIDKFANRLAVWIMNFQEKVNFEVRDGKPSSGTQAG